MIRVGISSVLAAVQNQNDHNDATQFTVGNAFSALWMTVFCHFSRVTLVKHFKKFEFQHNKGFLTYVLNSTSADISPHFTFLTTTETMKTAYAIKLSKPNSTTEGSSSLMIILPIVFGVILLVAVICGIYYLLVRFNVVKSIFGDGDGGDGGGSGCGEPHQQQQQLQGEQGERKTIKNAAISIDPVSPSVGGGSAATSSKLPAGGGSNVSTSSTAVSAANRSLSTGLTPGPPSLLDPRFGNMDSKIYLDVVIDEPTESDLDASIFNSIQANSAAKLAPKTCAIGSKRKTAAAAACSPKRPKTTMQSVQSSAGRGGLHPLSAGAKGRSPSTGGGGGGSGKVVSAVLGLNSRPNSRQRATPLNSSAAAGNAKKSAASAPKSRSASSRSNNSLNSRKGKQNKKKAPASAASAGAGAVARH